MAVHIKEVHNNVDGVSQAETYQVLVPVSLPPRLLGVDKNSREIAKQYHPIYKDERIPESIAINFPAVYFDANIDTLWLTNWSPSFYDVGKPQENIWWSGPPVERLVLPLQVFSRMRSDDDNDRSGGGRQGKFLGCLCKKGVKEVILVVESGDPACRKDPVLIEPRFKPNEIPSNLADVETRNQVSSWMLDPLYHFFGTGPLSPDVYNSFSAERQLSHDWQTVENDLFEHAYSTVDMESEGNGTLQYIGDFGKSQPCPDNSFLSNFTQGATWITTCNSSTVSRS